MSVEQAVLDSIDRQEVAELAVDLGNIYAPTGHEGPMGEFVTEWLEDHGFDPEHIGMTEDRYSVVAKIPGDGDGDDIAFNSHMDAIMSKDDKWMYRDPEKDIFHKAWIDDDKVYGVPVVNNRGPMACWMIAAKAIMENDVDLDGDLYLTMVPGEIEKEPIDEFQGVESHAQDLGARYMINHGVIPDYAIVAEATDQKLGWVEAGKMYFKITVYTDLSLYTPYTEYPEDLSEAPSAILRATEFIRELYDWAREYTEEYTTTYDGGTVEPKASIGAIRGGNPNKVYRSPELCSLYLDVRLTPDTDPRDVTGQLEELPAQAGVEADIKSYAYRKGYEAQDVEPVVDAMNDAHETIHGAIPERPDPPENSMWRDINPFNQLDIPAVNYGPGGGAGEGTAYFEIDDMEESSKTYALAALNVCRDE